MAGGSAMLITNVHDVFMKRAQWHAPRRCRG